MKLRKKKILKIILNAEKKAKQSFFFGTDKKCLVGLSGGQDSIFLGIFIRSLERKWNLGFDFVYCHHAWQQENFYTLMHITQYAAYTEAGCIVFLNPKEGISTK